MNTPDILYRSLEYVGGDRENTHGNKTDNHNNIARLWSGYLQNKFKSIDASVSAQDVASLMVLLKIARTQAGSHNIDDYVDACGYAAIAGEIAENQGVIL